VTRLSGRLAPITAAEAAAVSVMWLRVGMTGDDDDGGSLESIGSRHPSANTSPCRDAAVHCCSGSVARLRGVLGSRPGQKQLSATPPPPEFLGSVRMGPENKSAVQRRTKSGEQNSKSFSW